MEHNHRSALQQMQVRILPAHLKRIKVIKMPKRTREEAIQIIDSLFPIDSPYEETAEIGKELLAQAKRETEDWRYTLPDATLLRYADLCFQHERDGH